MLNLSCVLNYNLCELIHVLKILAKVTSKQTLKVFPEWRFKPGFRTQKNCLFPLNRGVPSIEETNTRIYIRTFFPGTKLWRGPLNRSVLKERFHCICTVFDWYVHHCPSPLTIKEDPNKISFFKHKV